MSEIVRNDVSTESLCTVIENISENTNTTLSKQSNCNQANQLIDIKISPVQQNDSSTTHSVTSNSPECQKNSNRQSYSESEKSPYDTCDTSQDESLASRSDSTTPHKSSAKLKKSVSFDPQDEKVRKFIAGEPIVDQQNPFKSQYATWANGTASKKTKKTPPPVPTKRSTLSVRKTVTQQLREREREKEKERERLKNEANNRKSNGVLYNTTTSLVSPDTEFITTEQVLNESKYVKTYIKNPDPYFVYDPTILARLKLEELRNLSTEVKKPTSKKLRLSNQTRDRIKDLKSKPTAETSLSYSKLPFKKCSKPNYPELCDIKIKVGTELEGNFFNPAEVTKNAKKFDDRAKKLHLSSDDDLDELDCPLTKSESSDEVTPNNLVYKETTTTTKSAENEERKHNSIDNNNETMDNDEIVNADKPPGEGTFTNTIKSKEFQEYLEKKGLTLIPKKIPNGARPVYTTSNGLDTSTNVKTSTRISFRTPESVQISVDKTDAACNNNNKKPSVFQRLLANSIFATRRKTTPKEMVPTPRSLHNYTMLHAKENLIADDATQHPTMKRVMLERQSFHGRPQQQQTNNLLSPTETARLKQQMERTRKSFAGGDNLSISLSSVLTNAELDNNTNSSVRSTQQAAIIKPPRRIHSREKLGSSAAGAPPQPQQQANQMQQQQKSNNNNNNNTTILKPKPQRVHQMLNNTTTGTTHQNMTPKEFNNSGGVIGNVNFVRGSKERQSLIPKRSTQTLDRKQVFGRSTSMDRNEILKRRLVRELQNRTKSDNETTKLRSPTTTTTTITPLTSRENVQEQFCISALHGGPTSTSTPIRRQPTTAATSERDPEQKSNLANKVEQAPPASNKVYVDKQEWERLKAIKERVDKELYLRMLQEQKQPNQQVENIYEHVAQTNATKQMFIAPAVTPIINQINQATTTTRPGLPIEGNNFIRGSPQRNTFSGLTRNRQFKIIDGKALIPTEMLLHANNDTSTPPPRSQSVLDNMTVAHARGRGGGGSITSDIGTPVVLRRKDQNPSEQTPNTEQRRIGGLLTRDEILQKVKEFCRKSLNKTPTIMQQQPQQIEAIHKKLIGPSDLSPVSYASVETNHHRRGSRMYAAPQVPQRMQSLHTQPQPQFIPIQATQVMNDPSQNTSSSPIYAHVVKRGSLLSNHSEMMYDSPQKVATLVRGSLAPLPPPPQYVLVENGCADKFVPATQVISYYHPTMNDIYAQSHYIRPYSSKLQTVPGAYGYISVREPLLPTKQQLRPRLFDAAGRSTPLILDHSSQQTSQIYWTSHNSPRWQQQQHMELVPVEINNSPRYVTLQKLKLQQPVVAVPVPVPAPRMDMPQRTSIRPDSTPIIQNYQPTTTIERVSNRQQQQQVGISSSKESNGGVNQVSSEWESGSEAGEVQRILANPRIGGELRKTHFLNNIRKKLSRLLL